MTTILITGASSGIGASTALHLDAQGVDVIAGVLPADALEGVEALDGVVDNAGVGVAGPLEVLPLDRLRETLEVNVLGQVAVTQAPGAGARRDRGRAHRARDGRDADLGQGDRGHRRADGRRRARDRPLPRAAAGVRRQPAVGRRPRHGPVQGR